MILGPGHGRDRSGPAALLLAAAAGVSQAQPTTTGAAAAAQVAATTAPAQASGVTPKLSPLLGLLLNRVVDAAIERSTGETSLGLFRRLASQLQGTATEPADDGLPPQRLAAAADGTMPAIAWAMEQLDPTSFAVLRPVPVAGSGPLLRTGDVFVLQFSTNLPGQVRLENTDPQGRVADLGTYTVLVDQLNRLPRDKGIQLQGQPGLERLRFYFYPCLPAEAAGKPWAAEFAGRLPACTGSAAGPLQLASAGSALAGAPLGVVRPRALVNLAQPDATMVFAGSTDYQRGEVTTMEAQIRHEARRAAR